MQKRPRSRGKFQGLLKDLFRLGVSSSHIQSVDQIGDDVVVTGHIVPNLQLFPRALEQFTRLVKLSLDLGGNASREGKSLNCDDRFKQRFGERRYGAQVFRPEIYGPFGVFYGLRDFSSFPRAQRESDLDFDAIMQPRRNKPL
jgi:hypothetical protein